MGPGDALPFDLDRGGRRGVLCIHGFTGTPFEVRYLGERLAERGFTVVAPTLPGHDGDHSDVNATGWRDWTAAMSRELEALRRRCDKVAVVGMSLGGLLTLHLAARADLAALAVLATPLWLSSWATAATLALRVLLPGLASIPKARPDIRDPDVRRSYPTQRAFPLHALASVLDFMPRVRCDLPAVRAPALILHADHDHVAPPACAPELWARLGSTDKRLIRLPRSYHIVTVDLERDRVAREVGDFLSERL